MRPEDLATSRAGSAAAAGLATWWSAAGADLSAPAVAGAALRAADDAGVLDAPLPTAGRTADRWALLAALGAADLTLARLAEAHLDALAILAELDGPTSPPGTLWGVWAAEPPRPVLQAVPDGPADPAGAAGPAGSGLDGAWRLDGTKLWCSGASLLDAALVTATAPDGPRLLAADLHAAGYRPGSGTWQAIGLSGSGTESVTFAGRRATDVGPPGAYTARPGFWSGAVGVAAVWWGGAAGIAAPLYASVAAGRSGPHASAHLGAVDAGLAASAALLVRTAERMDALLAAGDPAQTELQLLAGRARASVEAMAVDVVDRVGRALGPGPLCTDRVHARRVADLTVYLRQSHAERDLETLGRLAGGSPA